MTEPYLQVNEIFGPTIQGEGHSIGVPAIFVRVAGCPVGCSWCDTRYSWDWAAFDRSSESHRFTMAKTWAQVIALAGSTETRLLILTGGEPATQHQALSLLAAQARDAGWRVEVETSGAIDPQQLADACDLVTVSPKLANAGVADRLRINPVVLEKLAARENVCWKFVIAGPDDWIELDGLVRKFSLRHVMVMPQCDDPAELSGKLAALVAPATTRGFRISTRLQLQIWGNQRGR